MHRSQYGNSSVCLRTQQIFLKAMPFTLAIKVTNALFYTRRVLEKCPKLAIRENKEKM